MAVPEFVTRVAPELTDAVSRALTAHLPDGPLTGPLIRELDAQLAAASTAPAGAPLPYPVEAAVLDGIPVRLHRCESSTDRSPALIWFHGGGMIMGSAAGNDKRAQDLARDANCTVIVPDYRLAPEYPYPAAYQDCLTATRAVYDHAADLGIDPNRIALGGISAGGNLALGVALTIRGEHSPVLTMALCPMLDDRTAHCCDDSRPVWNTRMNTAAWQSYLGVAVPGTETVEWHAAPARCPELSGLSPIYLDVGDVDLFLAEDLQFALRAALAGVSVEVHVLPGAYHAWDSLVPDAPQSHDAHQWRIAALTRAFSK